MEGERKDAEVGGDVERFAEAICPRHEITRPNSGSVLSGLRRSRFEAMETLNNPTRDGPECDGRKHAVGLPNRKCGSSN